MNYSATDLGLWVTELVGRMNGHLVDHRSQATDSVWQDGIKVAPKKAYMNKNLNAMSFGGNQSL